VVAAGRKDGGAAARLCDPGDGGVGDVLPYWQDLPGAAAAPFGGVGGSVGELRNSAASRLPTTLETIVSFTIAGALGVGLAVAITLSDWVREALYPNIVLFQLIPKVALAPLFIIWLGVGSQSCVTFGVFISFFPVVVSTASGLVGASPDTLRMCRSLAASKWQIFCSIRFPYAMPFIFAGMKVGVTMAMIGVIVGEFITAQIGLGYIIMFASSAGETATVLAAIVLLCVAGLVLYGIVAFAELVMRRWYGGEIAIGGFV
jgi:NitT/TauT family transport system permease protein